MQGQKNTARVPGFLFALFPMAGVIIGAVIGEPVLGFLVGMGLAIVVATAFWLKDRKNDHKGPITKA
jgi:hypothetical protein